MKFRSTKLSIGGAELYIKDGDDLGKVRRILSSLTQVKEKEDKNNLKNLSDLFNIK